MIKVFIADDHEMVREGLRRILAEKDEIEVVGEAATFDELMERLPEVHPEIVILDISMPGPGFLESVHILRDREVRVLVLSMHPESHFAIRALKAGASAYLSKERTSGELIGAIQRVHEGRTYVTPSLAEELAESLVAGSDEFRHEHLSEREFQILLMLGSGKSVGEISRELSLSPKTVSTYKARVLQKLGLETTTDLIRYALHHQLV